MRRRPIFGSQGSLKDRFGIDVAAGEHHDRGLALDVDAAGENGGKGDGAAGLDHQLQFAEGEGNRRQRLVVGHRDGARVVGPVDGEAESPGDGASSASQIEPAVAAFATMRPSASERP